MASFTPFESTASLADVKPVVMRGRGHRALSVVIDKTCRVYITQIPVERIERDGSAALRAEFEAFGPIESYRMFTERSGRFIGSALCTFRNPADAALAIANMNQLVIEEGTAPLNVTVARDHGVMLLHDSDRHHSFLSSDDVDGEDTDGKWHHDKFQLMQEGKEMDEVLGIRSRGHGRGRGGRMTRGSRIDAEFEHYVAEPDRLLQKTNRVEDDKGVHPTVPANDAGNEESTAPVAPLEGAPVVEEAEVPATAPEGLQPIGCV